MARAKYQVSPEESRIVIRDIGDHSVCPTITNDADAVVAELHSLGILPDFCRLFYYDSNGDLDEICHDGQGGFLGFKVAEPRVRPKDLIPITKDDGPRFFLYEVIPGPIGEAGVEGRTSFYDNRRFYDHIEMAIDEAKRIYPLVNDRYPNATRDIVVEVWKYQAHTVLDLVQRKWATKERMLRVHADGTDS